VHEAEQGLAVEGLGARQGGQVEQQARHHSCQRLQQAQASVHRQVQIPDTQKIEFIFYIFFGLYSTQHRLPPLRFHCVGGCWD
jgi:hypothetical protein